MEAMKKACRLVGNQRRMAEKVGVSTVVVHSWCYGTLIPPKRCVQIEFITNGQVTRKDLRPDDYLEIWPELAEK